MKRATGFSFYEIVNNPKMLKKMTCEKGEDLTESEQIAKLERLMQLKNKPNGEPPEILS